MSLTGRQRLFVDEYLSCWNATEAARRAGYKGRPDSVGPQLLRNIRIAALVKAKIEDRSLKVPEGLQILGAHARSSLSVFFKADLRWTDTPLPGEEIIEEEDVVNASGVSVKSYLVKRIVVDMDQVLDPERAKLIKKFTSSPRNGVSIELYDAQSAITKLLEAAGAFTLRTQNLNVDLASLSEDQLRRIANGENPVDVVASTPGASGAGATQATETEDNE